jgi:hypothetical protein
MNRGEAERKVCGNEGLDLSPKTLSDVPQERGDLGTLDRQEHGLENASY